MAPSSSEFVDESDYRDSSEGGSCAPSNITEYSADVRWPDGMFLCDCNIGGMFANAAGEPNPQNECGAEKYAVKITDRAGRLIYTDQD